MMASRHPSCQTYSVVEAAAVLGVSDDNLYARLREDGAVAGIPGIRLGSSWRIPKAPLDALVSGRPIEEALPAGRAASHGPEPPQ